MTSSLLDPLASISRARVDCSRDEPSLVSLLPSALYSTSTPSGVVPLAVSLSFWMRPPRIIPSLALRSSMVIAAIFSRAVTIASSITDPSLLSIRRVVPSRTMLVRTSIISATDHSFSRNAASMSPGIKNEVRPSPPPTTISWLLDLSVPPLIIGLFPSNVKSFSWVFLSGAACPSGAAGRSSTPGRSPAPVPGSPLP